MKQAAEPENYVEVIIEKHDGLLWGRVENAGNYMPTPYGESKQQLIENLKELIEDYIAHEGRNDAFWSRLDMNNLQLGLKYDLQAFFQEHDYLKISSVAEHAGLNPGLVRQYASGVKHPGADQADKIRKAIKKIGEELSEDLIYAG
jgi:hypothetical protein